MKRPSPPSEFLESRSTEGRTERTPFSGDVARCPLTGVEAVKEPLSETSVRIRFRATKNHPGSWSLGVGEEHPWSKEIHLTLPAAAYAGNRFEAIAMPYSPRLPADRLGAAGEGIISDVPRLSLKGPSRLDLLAGDLAWPAVAWFDPAGKIGRIRIANVTDGRALFTVEEDEDRAKARVVLSVPGVRPSPVYRMISMKSPSPDVGVALSAGAAWTLDVETIDFDCADLAAFHDSLFTMRDAWARARKERFEPSTRAEIPFSHAMALIEEHYHRENWSEEHGLFATDPKPESKYWFQTGWCGGMIATLPLLVRGGASEERAVRNLETFFSEAQRPGGLFQGKRTSDGTWMADYANDAPRPHIHSWTLVRRQADALYFLLRQTGILEKIGRPVPEEWEVALRRHADVFVELFDRRGSVGQFIHQETGEILVEGSTSGALLPAALLEAARRYSDSKYLETARRIGDHFASHLERGVTTGGPGDALQNPDSESVAALVESYALLFEADRDAKWLELGRRAAALLSSWVMPYDFTFPVGTEFARLKLPTRGTVFANVQNKHSAPGLCTHSGLGLLRLYRGCGDERLVELGTSIARALPRFVSRPDRPIHHPDGRPLPSGWINERVNTSDWDENVGGVFYGSTWAEVSMMLTWLDWPGVYARRDLKRIWIADHVEAAWKGDRLTLKNLTPYPAEVSVRVEIREDLDESLLDQGPATVRIALRPGDSWIEP